MSRGKHADGKLISIEADLHVKGTWHVVSLNTSGTTIHTTVHVKGVSYFASLGILAEQIYKIQI